MNEMFEIVPKYPVCKTCRHVHLSIENKPFFGDGSLLSNCYKITCDHQDVCKEWINLEREHVHGDKLRS